MPNLINSAADLKANFGSLSLNFTWANISSFVEDVERDIIGDAIGDTQLAAFVSPDPALSGVPLQVATLLKRAESYLAILKWSQFALFQFEDKALFLAKTTVGAIPSDKKLKDLRTTCEESGYAFLDKAIDLMERNLGSFAAYKSSDNRTGANQCFIKTGIEFSKQRNISNSRLTYLTLISIMTEVQDTTLPGAMTPAYYTTFKTRYLGDTLTNADKLVLPLVQKAVAMYSIAEAALQLPLKITSRGIMINKYEGRTDYEQADPADMAQNQFLQDDHTDKAERALSKLRSYLVANADNIDGYTAPVIDVSPVNCKDSGLFNFM